jgi:membrane protease YdiL (CAAX protease family)
MILAALNVTWALVMARFGRGDIYWVVGLHAVAVCVVVLTLRGRAVYGTLVPRGPHLLLGVVAGVAMTAGTYVAFEVVQAFVPALGGHVVRLYRAAGTSTPAIALAWTLVILTAEELLWRGAWVDVWAPRIGMRAAAVSSVMAFTATQLGSGSVIVALVACVCGAIWTGLRVRTGSVVPGLVAHAIWTPTIILVHPVV